jgi:putative multiple sugar transport system permease protein
VLAGYNGLSWTVVIVLGRGGRLPLRHDADRAGPAHLCGGRQPRGGRAERHQRQADHLRVFGSMGMLSALSGILFTAAVAIGHDDGRHPVRARRDRGGVCRRRVGGRRRGQGDRLDHRRAGDASLTSGMNLMGVGIAYQYIVRGAVLVLVAAVIFDVATRRQ